MGGDFRRRPRPPPLVLVLTPPLEDPLGKALAVMVVAGRAFARWRRFSRGGSDVWRAVALRRGATKLAGEHGVETSVKLRPLHGGGCGALAMATSLASLGSDGLRGPGWA
jgi:hypothetical protein